MMFEKSSTAKYRFTWGGICLMALMIFAAGCDSGGSATVKDFNLVVVVSDKLGNSPSDNLPEEIIELSLPIEECDEYNFVPKPTLYRLGFDWSTEMNLRTKREKRFAGNPNNIRLIRREIEKNLSEIEVGDVFSKPGNPDQDLEALLKEYWDTIGDQPLKLLYNPMGNQLKTTLDSRVYSSIDSIRAAIARQLCESGLNTVYVIMPPARMQKLPPSAEHVSTEQSDEHAASGGMASHSGISMESMNMYNAVPIDGCVDFHCLKCTDRTACAKGHHCSIPNCGHEHAAVTCHQGSLFYIRESRGVTDEAGRPSAVARAERVAAKLNSLMAMMENHEDCYFTVLNEYGAPLSSPAEAPCIYFTMLGNNHKNPVVTVSPGDLWGYKYRAALPELRDIATPANRLSRKLIAQWWAYILKDHFNMMVKNEKPYLTTYTSYGKALLKIWENARALRPQGKIPMSVFTQVVSDLPSGDKSNLYLAAEIVPANFDPGIR